MKVDSFGKKISFTGSIIDSHMHIGNWPRNGNRNDMLHFDIGAIDTFTKTPLNVNIQGQMQQDEVEKAIVSNLDALYWEGKDEVSGNEELLSICKKDSKYYALAACQPTKTAGNAVKINNLMCMVRYNYVPSILIFKQNGKQRVLKYNNDFLIYRKNC